MFSQIDVIKISEKLPHVILFSYKFTLKQTKEIEKKEFLFLFIYMAHLKPT